MVIVAGNVAKVESKEINTKNGTTSVLNFSVAENLGSKEKKRTNFYEVAIFGKYANAMAPYVKVGSLVWVQGDLNGRAYTKKDGSPAFSFMIENANIRLLGGGKKDGGNAALADDAIPAGMDMTGLGGFVEVPDGTMGEIPFA